WAWGWSRPGVSVGVGFSSPQFFSTPVFVTPSAVVVDPCLPIGITGTAGQSAIIGSEGGYGPRPSGREELIPSPRQTPNDRTFPSTGGPASPVPMPQADQPVPRRAAPATIVPDGRVVSQTAKTKYSYAAYGEKPERRTNEDRQFAAKRAK